MYYCTNNVRKLKINERYDREHKDNVCICVYYCIEHADNVRNLELDKDGISRGLVLDS